MASERKDIEFRTVDGLTLRGWLFVGPKGGPAVIVNGAFNSPKEIFAADVAAWFGRNGLTALVYDARTLGMSDGLPRNDLDPQKMAEDNHDAVTFLQDDGWVDPSRIAIWGFFYSSGIALEAAAFDKRVAAVIAQGLMPEWGLNPPDQPAIVARAVEDRAKQIQGHQQPDYIPLLNDEGDHLMFFKYLAELTPEQKAKLPAWVHGAKKHAPTFNDRLTVQSFYRHAKWKPLHLIPSISPTPVMILTPEDDEIVPPKFQRSIFDSLQSEQKRFEIVKGRGHMNFLANVNLDELLAGQLAFLREVLKF
ncbi:DltD N-terminal domain protein [Lophiotrema nucula]|uniref:DltD N-terminal domain protein n=1 Tax=Lophiotrema nucula TaxID=690887 RepID=A0A6A5ZVC5_9PLEO|nr:DltD N-terminal domain protein [Lophiotrema nucula]